MSTSEATADPRPESRGHPTATDWGALARRLLVHTRPGFHQIDLDVATGYLPQLLEGWVSAQEHARVKEDAQRMGAQATQDWKLRRDAERELFELGRHNRFLSKAAGPEARERYSRLLVTLGGVRGRCPKPAEDCWKRHAACLARHLEKQLDETSAPVPTQEAVAS